MAVKLRPDITVSYDMVDVPDEPCAIRKREEEEAALRKYPPSRTWIEILEGRRSLPGKIEGAPATISKFGLPERRSKRK